MKILRKLLLAALLTSIPLGSCSNAAEKREFKPATARKGDQQGMKTYYMGRFAIDVPAEFKLAVQNHRFRLIEIEEYPEVRDADMIWREHLAKIEKTTKPKGVNKITIKTQEIDGMGKWSKGVLYYSDSMTNEECNWDIFVSYGNSAAVFSLKGLLDKQLSMFKWSKEVAQSYRPNSSNLELRHLNNGQFHTAHGVIELPYKRQEESYARFEGPMGMVLKVEMREIHKAPEKEGIIDRTIAAMATGFATGLDIKKIRSRDRTVAGLPGEEEILQGDDGKHKNVSFDWEYLGRVESGEQPMIQITGDTQADNLNEKILIWDKVLNSFRPTYQ